MSQSTSKPAKRPIAAVTLAALPVFDDVTTVGGIVVACPFTVVTCAETVETTVLPTPVGVAPALYDAYVMVVVDDGSKAYATVLDKLS